MKNFFISIIIILITFIIGEIFTRIFFSEFSKNQVFKSISEYERISGGKKQFFSKLQNLIYRTKKIDENLILPNGKKTVWFIGDSVTNGFGINFTDTYYFNLNQILKSQDIDLNLIATSNYGSNLYTAINIYNKNIKLFSNDDIIVYQFNYNDIIENSSVVKNNTDSYVGSLIKKTNSFRYAYLNNSTFLRTLQYYAGVISKNTSGSCESRGIQSLGSYSLAFGSKTLTEQSKKAWRDFSKSLEVFKNTTIANNNKLIVLLSPISLQIPFHEKNNILNYDLNCASIQPNLLMKKMLDDLQIIYSDPLPLFVEVAQTDFNEENQTSLFIFNDTNHPNPKGHLLLAYSLIKEILDNLKSN